jgi:hypothetical protein
MPGSSGSAATRRKDYIAAGSGHPIDGRSAKKTLDGIQSHRAEGAYAAIADKPRRQASRSIDLKGRVQAMRHMVNENEVAVTGLFAINPARENQYR